MGKTTFQTKVLAEIIVFSALSAALYTLRPFSLPYGGSITLGSMVPVMWLSLRRGMRVGFIAGAIFGLTALVIDVMLLPYSPITNPVQVILEYPIAFGVLGLPGLLRNPPIVVREIYAQIDEMKKRLKSEAENLTQLSKRVAVLENEILSVRALVGVGVGVFIKFLLHFIAGIIFWAYTVPEGWNPVVWSAVYNGSFLIPEFIISAILIFILVKRGTLEYAP